MTKLVAAPLRAVNNRPALSLTEQQYYLKRLANLSQRVAIHSVSNINNTDNHPILPQGRQLQADELNNLPLASLEYDFDKNLHIEGQITADTITGHFKLMIEADSHIKSFSEAHYSLERIAPYCEILASHPSLLTKLTCLSYCYPHAFKNALFTAWLGVICAELKNDPVAQTQALFLSALLQGLGLLFLPSSISLEAKNLTAEERVTLHAYPTLGYKLLVGHKKISDDVARAILEHRENLDGSGYPTGKLGNNISPTAQLLNVLSSLHAAYTYRLKPASRPISALASIIKMNGHTRFGRSGIKLIEVLQDEKATYEATLPSEVMPEFIALVRETFGYLKQCIERAESLSVAIGFRHNNSQLYALQNRIIHIDIAITQSEVINDAYLRLMEHIEKNQLTHAYGEIEDTFLRMHEVVFHIEKLRQSLAVFAEENPAENEHVQTVREGLQELDRIAAPSISAALKATWIGPVTSQRHDNL